MILLPPTASPTDCKRRAWPRRFPILDAYRGNPFPQSGMRSVGLTRGLTRVGPAECAFKPPPCDAADPNEVSEGATLYTKAPQKTASDAGRAHLCRWRDVANADLQRAEIAGDSLPLDPQVELQGARIVLT